MSLYAEDIQLLVRVFGDFMRVLNSKTFLVILFVDVHVLEGCRVLAWIEASTVDYVFWNLSLLLDVLLGLHQSCVQHEINLSYLSLLVVYYLIA